MGKGPLRPLPALRFILALLNGGFNRVNHCALHPELFAIPHRVMTFYKGIHIGAGSKTELEVPSLALSRRVCKFEIKSITLSEIPHPAGLLTLSF